MKIKPREASAIVHSLLGGVVPSTGIQHLTVGRAEEVEAFLHDLEEVKRGQSLVKFWTGDFGSGKSFMLHLLTVVALKENFVVAGADFTPQNRLYASDGKSRALYSQLMDSISIRSKPKGGALPTILEKWMLSITEAASREFGIPQEELNTPEYLPLLQEKIKEQVYKINQTGSFDFIKVVMKFHEGFVIDDENLQRNALRWFKGEYTTKTEARNDLGVRTIIDDLSWYDMLKNWVRLFTLLGYTGFVINLDEMINLYKISHSPVRIKNYEQILTMYNDCLQGSNSHMLINFAGTPEVMESERRGLYSYQALKTRLQPNKYETNDFRDFTQPVIRLTPLSHSEIFVLLHKVKDIYEFHYDTQIDISEDQITAFMEEILNKPGAREFLTPREVLRNFLHIMSIIRQNPGIERDKLFGDMEVKLEKPAEIEEL